MPFSLVWWLFALVWIVCSDLSYCVGVVWYGGFDASRCGCLGLCLRWFGVVNSVVILVFVISSFGCLYCVLRVDFGLRWCCVCG